MLLWFCLIFAFVGCRSVGFSSWLMAYVKFTFDIPFLAIITYDISCGGAHIFRYYVVYVSSLKLLWFHSLSRRVLVLSLFCFFRCKMMTFSLTLRLADSMLYSLPHIVCVCEQPFFMLISGSFFCSRKYLNSLRCETYFSLCVLRSSR